MNELEIRNRLENLGFIIRNQLKSGSSPNRVGTQSNPNKRNGWIYIKDKLVTYGDWEETIEPGYFFTQSVPLGWRSRNTVQSNAYLEQQKLDQEQKIKYLEEIISQLSKFNSLSTSHPYLEHKKSLVDNKLKIDDRCNLVIPAYNINKKIMGYQTISNQGDKFFVPGTILKGSFFPIIENGTKLEDANLILLAEGYSTSSSIFQAMQLIMTKCAVITCFSVGNIDAVAKDFTKHYNVPILVVKDNDSPGYMPVHMGFTVGKFGEDANDIHCRRGIDELKNELVQNLRFIKIG